MAIPQEIIDEVRERVSFVEVASEVLELKRSGTRHTGRCPFHSEKTPSFFINDEEGLFHCFGCGKSGSIYDFVMETRGFTFPEAVRFLANRVGITVPEATRSDEERRKAREKHARMLREVMKSALNVYRTGLSSSPHGRIARDYLKSRGLRPEIAEAFGLGFAPRSWHFIEKETEKELESAQKTVLVSESSLSGALLELGLLKAHANAPSDANTDKESETESTSPSRFYDAFRERVIFPITRSDGAPIALGGRTLRASDDAPKYINSCESPLYAKRRSFFGLSQALSHIRRSRQAYLVEGYMDVLSMVQADIPETLATCGTAVTVEHAGVLRRLIDSLTVVFDSDPAGQKAAASCFDVFLNSGVEVFSVMLPQGEDPDSMAQSIGSDELKRYLVEKRQPIVDVFIEQLFRDAHSSPEEVAAVTSGKISSRLAGVLSRVDNAVEREFLTKRASKHMGVSEEALMSLMKKNAPRAGSYVNKRQFDSAPRGREQTPRPQTRKASIESEPSSVEPAKPKDLSTLEKYYTQLVVSVLCEPTLAERVLNIPAVMEPQGEPNNTAERIREFLEELRVSGLRGIGEIVESGERNHAENDPELKNFENLLKKYGLNARALIDEAVRQCQYGGAQPSKVVADAQNTAERHSLKTAVDKIRLAEASESNSDELARLVQEKLLKRRSLEKLGISEKSE